MIGVTMLAAAAAAPSVSLLTVLIVLGIIVALVFIFRGLR